MGSLLEQPWQHDRSGVRRINDLMCESLDEGGRVEPVPFLCECGRPACCQQVWLTRDAYERARSDPAWAALARGHHAAAPA